MIESSCTDNALYTDSEDILKVANTATVSWTEKYRPRERRDLIGNPTAISQLEEFICSGSRGAALVSGPPGVGKTSAARLLCRIHNIDAIEFDASAMRNKKNLSEGAGRLAGCAALSGRRKILIMDEVDGMASDRGGIPELISIIKKSKVPIICICNDRNHLKMRTLANNCQDIRFRSLDPRTVRTRVEEILKNENAYNVKGKMAVNLDILIKKCGNDMRYILNTLQNSTSAPVENAPEKVTEKGIFELTGHVFSNKPISDKVESYFQDYQMLPLFVHENYIKTIESEKSSLKNKNIYSLANSTEYISFGDVIDSKIHESSQNWSLMPIHAFFSCAAPTNGRKLTSRIDFPGILGQTSRAGKNNRLIHEIGAKCAFKIGKSALRLSFFELLDALFMPNLAAGNISKCIDFLKLTNLDKDDFINISSIIGDRIKTVSAKNKSALTREAKKIVRMGNYINIKDETNDEDDSE